MRRPLTFATALLLACLGSSPTRAQIADWTGGGATDRWDEKGNWSGGDIPDTSGETSRFSVAGSFPVELPASFTVNDFAVTAGLPQLRPTAGVNPTITVSDDLIINNNAGLFLSAPGGEKLTIDIDDELRLDGGGGLTVDTSAAGTVTIVTSDLRLADLGTASGTINLIGPNTLFEQDGFSIINMGQDGPAQFTLSDRAQATFVSPLQLVNFADPGSTSSVLVESGSRLTLNSLQVATGGFNAGVNGSLTVTGNNSVATTTGVTAIGGASTPTGSVSVTAGGRYDSGGATTINASGMLTVDGGTFNAEAGLDNSSGGTINHSGGVINVTGGAFVPVDNTVATEYVINGAQTPSVVVGAGATAAFGVTLRVGATGDGVLTVQDGGSVNVGGPVDIGDGTAADGSLTVTGAGSTFVSTNFDVGIDGSGDVRIESGGFIDVYETRLGREVGAYGELVVTGTGSRLFTDFSSFSGGGSIYVAEKGDARLEVSDQGIVDGGALRVANGGFGFGGENSDGEVLIDQGTMNLTRVVSAGFNGAATIEVINGGSLLAEGETFLGPGAEITLGINASLAGSGTSSYRTSSFSGQGGALRFRSGTLTVTDPDQPLLMEPGEMSLGGVPINTLVFNDFYDPGEISAGQTIDVAGEAIVMPASTLALIGGDAALGGLTVTTGGRVSVSRSSELTVDGAVAAAIGSRIALGAPATTMGDPAAVNGVVVGGEFLLSHAFGDNVVTLLDANDAVFDSGSLLDLGRNGTIVADNGLTIAFGGNVTGEGTLSTPDDPTKPLINNGHIAGDSPTEPITLTGYVKGVGTCDNCVITGTDAPGFSPATVIRGSVAYRGVLEIEIGGTGSGDFDRLEHRLGAGVADLGGELQVESIDGYEFASGDAFEFLTADGGVTGVFATESLPAIGGGLGFDVLYGADSVTLAVVGIGGDYNYDGRVDAADYTVWRDSEGQSGAGLAADGNGDGMINGLDYDLWVNNYGSTLPASSTTVPEPSSSCLVLAALYCRLWRRR